MDIKQNIQNSNIIWDGFAIGNFELISHFLKFNIFDKKLKPEEYLKKYLDKLNIKIKSIDDINKIPKNDNCLQMIANCGYT